jgi:uncharacterized protein (UPF0332 family)
MRAQEVLEEAELLLGSGFTVGAVNRTYYACFYAASGLLLTEGHASSKHSGVMSLFNKFWIKPGRLPGSMGAFYHQMFDRRQKGDYEEYTVFEPSEAKVWVGEAKSFVDQIKTWLSENQNIDVS